MAAEAAGVWELLITGVYKGVYHGKRKAKTDALRGN